MEETYNDCDDYSEEDVNYDNKFYYSYDSDDNNKKSKELESNKNQLLICLENIENIIKIKLEKIKKKENELFDQYKILSESIDNFLEEQKKLNIEKEKFEIKKKEIKAEREEIKAEREEIELKLGSCIVCYSTSGLIAPGCCKAKLCIKCWRKIEKTNKRDKTKSRCPQCRAEMDHLINVLESKLTSIFE